LHFNTEWQPIHNFTIKAEIAHSELDRNLFSALDDGDNGGDAVNLESSLNVPLAHAGQIIISGRYKQEAWRFDPIDRNQEVEYRRKWDLPSDSTNGERYYEAEAQYLLNTFLKISASGGVYQRGDFNSDRIASGVTFNYKFLENLQINQELIRRAQPGAEEVEWTRRIINLTTRIGGIALRESEL
jgi:hypothetical protein